MLCIIQARMSSRRLKGKVLKKINGESILMIIYKQLLKVKEVDEIVIATSNEKSDIPIIKMCKKNKIEYHVGSLNNVYERFYDIVMKKKVKKFIRICADSPLINPKIISILIKKSKSSKYDLLTNIFPRSFPKGQSVEIISTDLFKRNKKNIKKKKHKEHITAFFYDNEKGIRIFNLLNKQNSQNINLSIDTKLDLNYVRKLLRKQKPKSIFHKYNSL